MFLKIALKICFDGVDITALTQDGLSAGLMFEFRGNLTGCSPLNPHETGIRSINFSVIFFI
jgi:hypothetical protein